MSLANADKHICKGLWTREEGKEKSVIEFVMTNTEHLNSIKEMIINETKEYATYRLSNVMLLKIDFHTETIQTKEHKIITAKGYKEYREHLEQLEISTLKATGQIQNSYDKWCEVVEQSIKRVTKKKIKTLNENEEKLKKRKELNLCQEILKIKQVIL